MWGIITKITRYEKKNYYIHVKVYFLDYIVNDNIQGTSLIDKLWYHVLEVRRDGKKTYNFNRNTLIY